MSIYLNGEVPELQNIDFEKYKAYVEIGLQPKGVKTTFKANRDKLFNYWHENNTSNINPKTVQMINDIFTFAYADGTNAIKNVIDKNLPGLDELRNIIIDIKENGGHGRTLSGDMSECWNSKNMKPSVLIAYKECLEQAKRQNANDQSFVINPDIENFASVDATIGGTKRGKRYRRCCRRTRKTNSEGTRSNRRKKNKTIFRISSYNATNRRLLNEKPKKYQASKTPLT